jgi:hypothetical protein
VDQSSIPGPAFNLVQIAHRFLIHAYRFIQVDPGQAPLQIASPTNYEHKKARMAGATWASVLAEPGYLRLAVSIRYKAVLAVMTLCLPAEISTQSTRNSWYCQTQN